MRGSIMSASIEDGREAFNISSAIVSIGAHAQFNTFAMNSGAGVSRYQDVIAVAGEGSRVETNGVNLLNGKPACRHHAVAGSRGAELRQPRNLPRRGR